jgi:hypothetical protein
MLPERLYNQSLLRFMELFKKIAANTVFALQLLLIFILVFESRIIVPSWLQAFGRLHPLLLHLPIGLLLLTAILFFLRKHFKGSIEEVISFLIYLTSVTASIAAFMGVLLSFEGGYSPEDLFWHKWLGVALSFTCWIVLTTKENHALLKIVLPLSVALLVVTGHFGANLTHGKNFVFGPLQKEQLKTRVITDSTSVFSALIEPIFETRCVSCHSEQKSKGKLILSSLASVLKGGKDGVLWKPGDPDHSLMVKRLKLPLESKEHMPPKDKTQLSAAEIVFIDQWIRAGADTEIKLGALVSTDTLKKLSTSILAQYQHQEGNKPLYSFDFVSQEKIHALSTPYRTVFQIAGNEPALQADFYLATYYQKKYLEELDAVKDQLVALNLARMPVEDTDLSTIAKFYNLENLILNNTNIGGKGLKELIKLKHLQTISLSGTNVNAAAVKVLAASKNLKGVYLWNTNVSPGEIKKLRNDFKNIQWEGGYEPDEKEKLRLSIPMLKNDGQVLKENERVTLKHNLPGVMIRYSLDGKDPDSLASPIYKEPLQVKSYSIVKTKAYKDGWISSNKVEFLLFKSRFKPDRLELITRPEDRYPGEGSATLVNGTKGLPDFYRDPSWMGFRNEPLEAYFFFEGSAPALTSVTLSYARNIGAMCMPPASMEIWGGSDPKNLKLLNKIEPEQPTAYVATRIEGATMEIPSANFRCYKIIARPLSKLPAFRKEKQKGWLMVDELFFN